MFDITNHERVIKLVDSRLKNSYVEPLYVKIYNNMYGLDELTEEAMYLAHPRRVACGKVFVYGHNVNALARERVEVARKRCNERFALARAHLGDAALVQDDAADELNVEMSLPDGAPRRLANDRERLGKHRIKALAAPVAALEFLGLAAKLLVRKLFDAPFELVDLLNERPYLLYLLLARVSEKSVNKSHV